MMWTTAAISAASHCRGWAAEGWLCAAGGLPLAGPTLGALPKRPTDRHARTPTDPINARTRSHARTPQPHKHRQEEPWQKRRGSGA